MIEGGARTSSRQRDGHTGFDTHHIIRASYLDQKHTDNIDIT